MQNCIVLSGGAGNSIQDVINTTSPSLWPLYLAKAWLMVPMSNPIIMRKSLNVVENSCVDCRLHGGVLQKPDYWEDN